MKVQRIIAVVLLALAALEVAHVYPLLPERVASHFDAAGAPNGWAPKDLFVGLYAGVLAIMAGSFFGLPVAMASMPTSMINLPNKDFWLAPERRDETWERVAAYMNAAGNAVMALLVYIFHLAFEANLGGGGPLGGGAAVALFVFVVFLIGWTVAFMAAFAVPIGGGGRRR